MPERERPVGPVDIRVVIRNYQARQIEINRMLRDGGMEASRYFELMERQQEDLQLIRIHMQRVGGSTGKKQDG